MSNATVDAAVAASLAELAASGRVADVPTAPLGYGRDLSCVADITPDAAEVDPMSETAVVQAVIHRLTTARGTLIDDPDYGIDVRAFCNRASTPLELRAIADQCAGEIAKDDRVLDATVTATFTDATRTLRVSVRLECADPTLGTFDLTFAVDATGQVLLETI